MTVVLKASGPADLLAMVPALVGFTPRNSVVLLAFRGKRTRGALRFDLPRSESAKLHSGVVNHVVGTLCKIHGVDAVIAVICTDRAFGAESAIPHSAIAGMLNRRIEQSGFELRNSLCHAVDGWASYLDEKAPVGGNPLAQIAESAVSIPADLRSSSSGERGPRRLPDADQTTMTRVTKQLANYRGIAARFPAEEDSESLSAPAEFEPLTDLPLFVEEALGWDDATADAHDALLLFVLQGPLTRDMVMVQWATSISVADRLWREAEEIAAADEVVDNELGEIMMGNGPRPDPDRVERGIELLVKLVSRVQDVERLAPLCMLAWLNWALGRGTVAGRHIDEAREIDADYGMAVVLDTMLSNGMLPEWAFADY